MPRSLGMGERSLLSEPDRAAYLAEAGLSIGPVERPDRLIDQSLAL